MKLHGQVTPLRTHELGYAMAVLLVGMSVAAVLMTVAMPVWKQMAQREKEEELIFRGQQYVRALRLFGTKYANASPPNLDVLVEQRFLRKKYKDPITNDDFQALLAGQNVPGAGSGAQDGRGGRGANDGRGGAPLAAATGPQGGGRNPALPGGISGIGSPGAGATGGVIGVASKSKDKSIKLYNGRSHYNEWAFINTPQTQAPGGGAGGVGAPGQRGGQRGGPGQPGQNPFNGPGPFPGRGERGGRGGPGGRGIGPGGGSQFPQSPFEPSRPIQPGRGRGA